MSSVSLVDTDRTKQKETARKRKEMRKRRENEQGKEEID
jgi:hypothetical protein